MIFDCSVEILAMRWQTTIWLEHSTSIRRSRKQRSSATSDRTKRKVLALWASKIQTTSQEQCAKWMVKISCELRLLNKCHVPKPAQLIFVAEWVPVAFEVHFPLILHCVSKKLYTRCLIITFSNVDGLLKFVHRRIPRKLPM